MVLHSHVLHPMIWSVTATSRMSCGLQCRRWNRRGCCSAWSLVQNNVLRSPYGTLYKVCHMASSNGGIRLLSLCRTNTIERRTWRVVNETCHGIDENSSSLVEVWQLREEANDPDDSSWRSHHSVRMSANRHTLVSVPICVRHWSAHPGRLLDKYRCTTVMESERNHTQFTLALVCPTLRYRSDGMPIARRAGSGWRCRHNHLQFGRELCGRLV